ARLPVQFKLRGRNAKYLLKRAFADLLPPENVHRRKMGFGVPVGQWFRGPLRELLDDVLLSDRSFGRGYFQPAEVKRLVSQHQAAQADHSFPLWSLLMLELWHREFIDAPRGRGRWAVSKDCRSGRVPSLPTAHCAPPTTPRLSGSND